MNLFPSFQSSQCINFLTGTSWIIDGTIIVNFGEFFSGMWSGECCFARTCCNKLGVLFTYCGGVSPGFMRAFKKPLKWTQQVIISCSSPWNRPPYNADHSSVTVRRPAVLEHPSSVSCYHFRPGRFCYSFLTHVRYQSGYLHNEPFNDLFN